MGAVVVVVVVAVVVVAAVAAVAAVVAVVAPAAAAAVGVVVAGCLSYRVSLKIARKGGVGIRWSVSVWTMAAARPDLR